MFYLTVGDCADGGAAAAAPCGSVGVCAALLLLEGPGDVDALSFMSTLSSKILVIVVSTQLV